MVPLGPLPHVAAQLKRHGFVRFMKTAFTRFCMTLVVVLLAGGCGSDEVLSPGTGPGTRMADFVPVAGGTVTVPIPNQATPEGQAALPTFSRRTLLRATMTGTVEITASPYNPGGAGLPEPGQARTVGLPGFQYNASGLYYCGAQLRVAYSSGGFVIPCVAGESMDTVVSAQGFFYAGAGEAGTAFRTAGSPNAWYCSKPGGPTGPCWYYSTAGQTVTIERVTAELNVTATPTTVNYLDTVTVTVSISPAQAGGFNVPWTIDSVRWVADSFGTQVSPCTWNLFVPNTGDAPSRTCRRPFSRSGTLTVSATVSGDLKQKAVRIEVTPPQLKVTASPASIPSAQSVTFTASVTPSWVTWSLSGSGWTWRPDSGTGGISPSNCWWYEKTCTRTIAKSGWMKATATVGEYALKDSARVLLGTPPRLQLAADKQAITAGETVTFTTSAGGEPYTISSWVYRVDSTSQSVACGTALQCVTPLTTTGTMWVFGAVLDRPDSASAAVEVAGVACDDIVLTIIGEYETFQVNLQPTCPDFSDHGGTAHFSWSELNGGFEDGNPHEPWGMVRAALTTGLEATRTNYNRGGIRLSSGYRCPHGNTAVGSTAPQTSYHMHGRAADMFSSDHTWTEDEFNLLKTAADATGPIESFLWTEYPDHHYHAAW